jgi:hypothetical protein
MNDVPQASDEDLEATWNSIFGPVDRWLARVQRLVAWVKANGLYSAAFVGAAYVLWVIR